MTPEVSLGFKWLYGTLTNDSTLMSYIPATASGVCRSMAPDNTATPFIVMAYMSGIDNITMNAFRIMSDMTYMVKVAGPATELSTITQASTRIDTLLGGPTSGSVVNGIIASCNRQSSLAMDELVSGNLWFNLGGLYRIIIQSTS